MACTAATFVLVPRVLMGAFTRDEGVVQLGASLLAVAAIFQIFDGVQGVATGVLRGLGDTRTPMLWNLFAHWFIGLPGGYVLCFVTGPRRDRTLVGLVGWPDHLRRRAARGLGTENPGRLRMVPPMAP